MLKSYIKITLRNLIRQKIYASINLAGLVIGLSITLGIAFFVLNDLTFDRFHASPDHVFRVVMRNNVPGRPTRMSAIISGPMLPAAKEGIPEVTGATRLTLFGRQPIARGESENQENQSVNQVRALTLVADPGFFDVFSFRILSGDESALAKPNGVLLTPEIAEAVFGEDDPVGQPLQLGPVENAYVAGIVEAPPSNSHVQFEIIIPLRVEQNPVWWDSWENQTLTGYIRVHEGADRTMIEEKMNSIAHTRGFPEMFTVVLQPLLDVHLGSADYFYDMRNFGKKDISVVYTLAAIGLMILIIASINFINLSSARAAKRAREVGMRKVIGSQRKQLIIQFLGESVFMTVAAMVISLIIVEIALPQLENFLDSRLEVNFFNPPLLLPILFGVALLIGVLSGIYPALILSAYDPIEVLRGEFRSSQRGVLLRRILVVCQFVISIALITGVFTVIAQIRYLRSMNFGYNREQVIAVPNPVGDREDVLKNELKNIPTVISAGRTSALIGSIVLRVEVIPEGSDPTRSINWPCVYVDEGFFAALEIPVVSGRNFSVEFLSDREEAVMMNEAAVRLAGWDDPVGKRLDLVMEEGSPIPKRVVGVVRDFHFSSARRALEPMVFIFNPQRSFFMLARLAGGQIVQAKDQIESVHRGLYPDRDFQFFFLDDVFNRQFDDDRRFASHIGFFSAIAVFIACLGLLGLVSFAVEQRRQEIAVRKVLGCSEGRIIKLLALDFLKWVMLANLIAWPVSYFSMERWLDEFVYRVSFPAWPYLLAGISTLVIAMLTVSFQSIRAARKNPADALRQEL
jgi:putative ABC transport system permease protein